ncbi:MAG: kynureninase [Flavobacteriales bacterium]|nr:kynureninase [Flavobacteriales bacterium]
MEFTLEYAQEKDLEDSIRNFRDRFYIPQHHARDCIYFTGNSLGLQPKGARKYLEEELEDWAEHGVEGHFRSRRPWVAYHEFFSASLAKIVGAKEEEVVAMGSLTANLHFLMATFYRPSGKRNKILCEKKAFPSDAYALASQAQLHGLDPEGTVIEVGPREGEHTIRLEDILAKIEELGDELAMVMIGGVNYYSGQVFDMKTVTEHGHRVGANVGFDLAHAAGNIKMQLHDWNVDFAAWCTYKYMNSSPGGVAGIFVHEKHASDKNTFKLAGWWGHNKERRFLMEPEFDPIPTAESWQLSNAPVMTMACHRAALDLFDEAGMDRLIAKSRGLTNYLEFVIAEVSKLSTSGGFEVITPSAESERGCQLSILAHGQGKPLFDKLTDKGVVADWREPNVIRIAPVPLYNSYEDVYRFGEALERSLN